MIEKPKLLEFQRQPCKGLPNMATYVAIVPGGRLFVFDGSIAGDGGVVFVPDTYAIGKLISISLEGADAPLSEAIDAVDAAIDAVDEAVDEAVTKAKARLPAETPEAPPLPDPGAASKPFKGKSGKARKGSAKRKSKAKK